VGAQTEFNNSGKSSVSVVEERLDKAVEFWNALDEIGESCSVYVCGVYVLLHFPVSDVVLMPGTMATGAFCTADSHTNVTHVTPQPLW
jgi:hypothetical protein